jgi:protein-S-isoprenylcysteine O-methyltransferase Ste14
MTHKNLGLLLVALQFSILAVLLAWVLVLGWGSVSSLRVWSLTCWGLSLALGVGALMANRPGNFNIRPVPKVGGRLIEHGLYRWIRHPMYSSVLLLAAGCAWSIGTLSAWGLWGLLWGVLLVKAREEDRLMAKAHPGYTAYRARTKRFVPFIF